MIKLAVILCGGLGTRLNSLTKNTPKGMITVSKKPFLEHLILQLKENNIKKVLLLTGFKSEKIYNYFGDGKKFGIKIMYSFSDLETQTMKRIYNARKIIKNNFILLYSDNYYPLNLQKLYYYFKKQKKPICINLCKKNFGNFKFNSNNIEYSKNRKKKFNYVEIGYSIFNKKILNYIPSNNLDLKYFLEKMIKKKKISFFKNYHKYLSISDRKRLELTRTYFLNKNIVLIDRDGTLNKKLPGKRYLTNASEISLNFRLVNIIKKFKNIEYICITNQAGVATKDLSQKNLLKINTKLKKMLKRKGIKIKKYYVNTDHFKSNSFERKPNPGLFLKASERYKFLLDKTIYIGDDKRDIIASYNASTKCFFLGEKKPKIKENKCIIKNSLYEYLKTKNNKK